VLVSDHLSIAALPMKSFSFAATLLVLTLGACATAPTQEMSDARFALRAAEEAGARTYTPETLAAARGTITNAERQLETGSFVDARNYAIQARETAMRARNMALALAEASDAVERASQLGVSWSPAAEALKKAREAASRNDELHTLTESAKAVELSELAINQANLELAKRILDGCQPGKYAENIVLVERARRALAEHQGKEALTLAKRACGGSD
jgi:hypothetical protein